MNAVFDVYADVFVATCFGCAGAACPRLRTLFVLPSPDYNLTAVSFFWLWTLWPSRVVFLPSVDDYFWPLMGLVEASDRCEDLRLTLLLLLLAGGWLWWCCSMPWICDWPLRLKPCDEFLMACWLLTCDFELLAAWCLDCLSFVGLLIWLL